jgi:two-component system, OmpR family, response regulator ResD
MQSDPSDRGTGELSGSPPRLLLCDDSAIERTSLAQILRRHGYEVDEAADGAAALLLIKSRRYDMLLLDLQMPGVDGFDVLAHCQQHRTDLPIVLLSGLPPDEIGGGIQRLPSHELPPLLLKPIDTQQLAQVIELKLAGELP